MRIFLIGESSKHEAELRSGLHGPHRIVGLPAEAADSASHDTGIEPGDVVVTLRWSRPAGQAPPLGLLQVPGAGLDRIELSALRPETVVANVFEHEVPIAEFVLARLLEWEIRAAPMQSSFGPGEWSDSYRHRVPHGEIHGRTLGIIGYGRIGRAIATRAAAFGVRILAVDEIATPDGIAEMLPTGRIRELLSQSDYVVLSCPLTPETTGLIDAAALDAMQEHAVLVNVSRAPIADEDALYTALRDRRIGGAILDVWYRYPGSSHDLVRPASRPFWELPNVWCTPHSSAWTHQLPRRRYAVIADNINRLVAGEPLRNVVRAAVPQRS